MPPITHMNSARPTDPELERIVDGVAKILSLWCEFTIMIDGRSEGGCIPGTNDAIKNEKYGGTIGQLFAFLGEHRRKFPHHALKKKMKTNPPKKKKVRTGTVIPRQSSASEWIMDFFFFGRMLHNDGALETTMGRTAPQRLVSHCWPFQT